MKAPIRFVFAPKLSLLNVYPCEEAAKEAKVKGGSSIAPAKAAVVASAKPMSLELAKGINLELIPCPAGEFEMGRHEFAKVDGLYPHKVKISRPFWLSKNRVTFEQFETFRKTDVWKDENVKQIIELLGGRQCPVSRIARADFDQFCRYLGQKYSSKIPKGYVFRLPTDAEWAYAFRANSQDPDDPYALDGNDYKRFRKVAPANSVGWQWPEIDKMLQEKGLKSKEGRVAPKVGTRAANKWGIQDLDDCGAELVLDVIDVRKDNPHPHWRLCNFDNKSFCYGAYEFDPLRLYEGEGARSVTATRKAEWGRLIRLFVDAKKGYYPDFPVFRLCLGPDLIAEKKAKK